MRNNCEIDGAALDRFITGNYGEDQYKDSEECEECEHRDEDCGKDPTFCKMERKEAALAEKGEQEMEDKRCGI